MSKRWMYQTLEVPSTLLGNIKSDVLQETLNREGQRGWELASIVYTATMSSALVVLKKEA
ncbi:DUF4177 domain-containing protein [uncultured Stenotrophomonas sp.]|uniref:DUF4177 domain-containing protein n=1 Tax=uncultured Stenotrophomonas sp. TaxID=165438 RepID=UPI0025E59836|nr:DUF4177 domain-containing protein [uncultured Stenotrophomonas sp.]HDS1579006.1 DUF4177 domain-containing protein [Stenotrophomonas maltophilia]